MFLIKYIFKLIKVLNSNADPKQVALGMAYGAVLGLIPVSALHWWLILILMYITNSNLAAAAVFTVIFKLAGMAAGGVMDSLGYAVLAAPGLENLFTRLYNVPVIPLTRFYNTVVMGSTLISVVIFIPLVVFFKKAVIAYRSGVRDRIAGSKAFKVFMKLPLVGKLAKLYGKASSVRGAM